MSEAALALLDELKQSGTRYRAVNEKRYLKSQAEFYGVTVPRTRALTRTYSSTFRKEQDLSGALRFARALWSDGGELSGLCHLA